VGSDFSSEFMPLNCENGWRRKRIHGSPMRPRLLRNQGPPPRSKRFLTACDVAEIVQKYESGNTTQA
jgi:hypothetical protein